MRLSRINQALFPLVFLPYEQCFINCYTHSTHNTSVFEGKNPRNSVWKTRRRTMCNSKPIERDDCSSSSSSESSSPVRHYCFLVHGWLGNNEEMSYMEHAIKKSLVKIAKSDQSDVLIYRPMSNHDKTNDGIAMGGKRIAEEILEYIRETSKNDKNEVIKTISFVGNSLGGLYSRFAITELEASKTSPTNLHFNVFYTTATPHIGVSSHTYIPLPRVIESWLVAPFMGQTGRNLFRTLTNDDIIHQMSLSSKYLTPLSHFKSRVAYANSFGSDFQVPTQTAAFLHEDSKTPHYVINESQKNNEILVSVHTDKTYDESATFDPNKCTDELLQMSRSLDSLGWRKVFVDVRHLSPISHVPIPFSRWNSKENFEDSLSQRKMSISSRSLSDYDNDGKIKDETTKVMFRSNELAELLSSGDSISLPVGHTVMIANSKSDFYKKINAGGKIVMDSFADDFVHELLKWTE